MDFCFELTKTKSVSEKGDSLVVRGKLIYPYRNTLKRRGQISKKQVKLQVLGEVGSGMPKEYENGDNAIIPRMKDKGGALDAGYVNITVKCYVVRFQPLGEKPVDDRQRPIDLQ
ncbi:hypothetical protein OUZ56_019346 [Daphnia magna]|uniref:Uncharacterized protein n=1 Tax=Daphnia magna TaxID=35525 RepID=A0ABQ9ZBY2_9CRUS|nr:hypothetical protein OUZ56_019346 [Daphnia magna]